MTSRKGKIIIGLFVIGALGLLCATMIILGSGSFNSHTTSFVLYFDTSVRGLTNGAAVYFNGVRVGKVTSMAISHNTTDMTFSTPIIISLEKYSEADGGQGNTLNTLDSMDDQKIVHTLIKKGLRAKLTTSSFITGLLVIDLMMVPGAPPVEIGSLKPYNGIPQIPTIPSGIDSVLAEFADLPIQDFVKEALAVLININRSLDGIQFAEVSQNLQTVMVTLDKTLLEYTKIANSLNGKMDSLLAKTDSTLESFDEMAKRGSAILQGNSATMQNLYQTMSAIREAAVSISYLARLLEKRPEALIFGKGN